jgi:hypothetical protein
MEQDYVVGGKCCRKETGRNVPLHARNEPRVTGREAAFLNKRFEQSPDSNVSVHRNPGFHVYVWPLRA